jgi:hypothetical protein
MRYSMLPTCESPPDTFPTCVIYFNQHIYYLCTSQESHLLDVRLRTLFPSLQRGKREAEAVEQFHWDFSKEEREDLDEAARQCVFFLKEETEWEQSREIYWKEEG